MTRKNPFPEDELTVELETSSLRALLNYYVDLNQSLFGGQLKRPALRFTEGSAELGRWESQGRTITLSRSLLYEHGWGVLVEVLKHEMAHQFVDEILGCPNESAHGSSFRKVCEERAIDPRAAGVPVASPATAESARVLERVGKLLALAESPNQHEAQAAASAAQRLMLKHNIDTVAQRTAVRYAFRHLGKPTGRVSESERLLASILGDYFFVQVIWVPVWRPLENKRGSVLEVCGTPENLEIAEYVHTFLTHTAHRLWLSYKRANKIRRDAERRHFIAGVMSGFDKRLERERRRNAKQGLVWVKDAQLESYLRRRHRYIRWGSYGAAPRTDAYTRGQEAGQRIVLHQGMRQGSSGAPKLLPPSGRR